MLTHFFMEDMIIFKELIINEKIREREVRLIDENGVQLGVLSTYEANRIADERNLDLVKMASTAKPPVCKLMDYGKYRFENLKKEKEAKKNQKTVDLKDVWLSQTIDIGDMNTKAKNARKFIEQGNKVRMSIRMKGRQQAHPEVSIKVLKEFFEMLKDIAIIEKEPLKEGRSIMMILAPIKK